MKGCLPITGEMEKLSKILKNTQIKRIIETESFILQIANLVGIGLLIMSEIAEHVWNHLAELNNVKEEFDDLRIRIIKLFVVGRKSNENTTTLTMIGAKRSTTFFLQSPSI